VQEEGIKYLQISEYKLTKDCSEQTNGYKSRTIKTRLGECPSPYMQLLHVVIEKGSFSECSGLKMLDTFQTKSNQWNYHIGLLSQYLDWKIFRAKFIAYGSI